MSPSSHSAVAATLLAGLVLVACGSSSSNTTGTTGSGGGGTTSSSGTAGGGGDAPLVEPDVKEDLGGRDYDLKVPADLDMTKPAPLLLALHGFVGIAEKTPWLSMDAYMHLHEETDKRGMILALPHGTIDKDVGSWSWNGTDACCGWDTMANDVAYLMAVISDIESKYNVDKKRIFFLGHSNGGFMAHRLACDRSSRIAGIVSLAGETFKHPKDCIAANPIAMLQVQGTADKTVSYTGGSPLGIAGIPPAPGAEDTAKIWAAKNHCEATPDTGGAAIDLVTNLAGAETKKTAYKGCEANGDTELWTIENGPHSPAFNATWAPTVIDFLMAHPKE
ncbi:MAG: alpha/beta fold hydrolase [Minicystis sp.]